MTECALQSATEHMNTNVGETSGRYTGSAASAVSRSNKWINKCSYQWE
jgi:hypothetical protein